MAEPRTVARTLAGRLRELRVSRWPEAKLTLRDIAAALGVSQPLVSSWENGKALPAPARLAAYARFFATKRSLDGTPHLVGGLRDDEERERRRIESELMAMLTAAEERATSPDGLPSDTPWQFPDGGPVRMVVGTLPKRLRTEYGRPDSPDYVRLYNYMDLDALVELHGHIRAANPRADVRYEATPPPGAMLEGWNDTLTSHLVLIGGVDANSLFTDIMSRLGVPITQVARDERGPGDVGGFDVEGVGYFQPQFSDPARTVLTEDVGLFIRARNPLNAKRTVSICNGMYGRGTYGMVRTLTHNRFRDRNTEYLEKYASSRAYCLLARVNIVGADVNTPDFTDPATILYEWTGPAA